MSFTGKVVIVTGSSSGIGAATAIQFSKEGAHVVIVGRNEGKLKNVAEQCNDPLVVRAELAKDEDVQNIVKQTIERFGKIDVLVNNAGVSGFGSLQDGEVINAYDKIFPVNVRAPMYLTSLATPHLIKTKGNVVNISSVTAQTTPSVPQAITYYVSKAAVNHFTTCAALEMAPHGVRVNAISPGPVRTDILDNTPGVTWDHLKEKTALKRVSEPEEIAELILYLASDKAKGITGSNFLSDNGCLILK